MKLKLVSVDVDKDFHYEFNDLKVILEREDGKRVGISIPVDKVLDVWEDEVSDFIGLNLVTSGHYW